MKITTQQEFDNLPLRFENFTGIEIYGNIIISRNIENSHIEARENSHVVARENSHVEARENSHVVAWGNSHVEAWGNVSVYSYSDNDILLYGFVTCYLLNKKSKAIQKSKNSRIVPFQINTVELWLENEGVEINSKNNSTIVFKRVSNDFKTQENTKNETSWKVGSFVEVPNWNPSQECGKGKFHACSKTYFCDEFRTLKDDKYIAIEVPIEDLFAFPHPNYPHKISFKKGTVLYECDRYGKQIK